MGIKISNNYFEKIKIPKINLIFIYFYKNGR